MAAHCCRRVATQTRWPTPGSGVSPTMRDMGSTTTHTPSTWTRSAFGRYDLIFAPLSAEEIASQILKSRRHGIVPHCVLKGKTSLRPFDAAVEASCCVQDGAPLRLNMWGVNLYTGGHFDLYVADYFDYQVSCSFA